MDEGRRKKEEGKGREEKRTWMERSTLFFSLLVCS